MKFEDVSFHYDKLDGIVDGVSLCVKGGEKIGIVGPSGSGKTTLVHLMMRFFDPHSGRILIDDQDISKVRQDSLRKRFSFVPQDVQLFHRSVSENIAYGSEDVSAEDIENAARLADAHDFILELEDKDGNTGYAARVGERGVKLSGGQRQRLAIARALLRNAPILVLDEATSQLDSVIEGTIQKNLLKQMHDKTVFIIAHRLSTIAGMDRIVVMQDGKIIGEGTHEALLAENPIYAEMWLRQAGVTHDS